MAAELPRPTAPSRPNGFDFFVLLFGVSLSLLLLQLPLPHVDARPPFGQSLPPQILAWLRASMRLSEGIILVWPILYPAQRILGRTQPITAVEWLWIFSWLGVASLNVFHLAVAVMPDDVRNASPEIFTYWPAFVWYAAVAPAIGLLALLARSLSAARRAQLPWTATFGTVLLVWPVLPTVLTLFVLGQFTTWIPAKPAPHHTSTSGRPPMVRLPEDKYPRQDSNL